MDELTTQHWTEKSVEAFAHKVAADFTLQIERHLSNTGAKQRELAKQLGVTPARISQVLNNPGNMMLSKVVKYARVLGKKVALVVYDDNDPKNMNGPINAQVFEQCWQQKGKPTDLFDIHQPCGV